MRTVGGQVVGEVDRVRALRDYSVDLQVAAPLHGEGSTWVPWAERPAKSGPALQVKQRPDNRVVVFSSYHRPFVRDRVLACDTSSSRHQPLHLTFGVEGLGVRAVLPVVKNLPSLL